MGGKGPCQHAQLVGMVLQRQFGAALGDRRRQVDDRRNEAARHESAQHDRSADKAKKADREHRVHGQFDAFVVAFMVHRDKGTCPVAPGKHMQSDAIDRHFLHAVGQAAQ